MENNLYPELTGDYQTAYNEYWRRPDRFGQSSFDDVENLSTQVLKLCGAGSILDVGCGMGVLVRKLLSKGINAYGIDISSYTIEINKQFAPERFKVGSILDIPWENESVDTVICTDVLEHLKINDVPIAVKELFRVSKRFAFCTVSTEPDRDKRWHLTVKDKKWWEEQFFAAGFRKHPLYMTQLPYESLENESGSITFFLEKIPTEAIEKFPMEMLLAERDLHMDMLREYGRRSDAHIARYTAALKYVRPHDVVVDVACGMGYGSAILWDGTLAQKVIGVDNSPFSIAYNKENYIPQRPGLSYMQGDAHQLDFLENSSADVFISMETVEHLENPEIFFEHVKRVLRPGGRIILSVPNDWTDETGKDPNPHHLHVFDREKITAIVQKFFYVEQIFGQVAGGSMKLGDSPRTWFEYNENNEADAEWWIIVGMKNPVTKEEPYVETALWKADNYPIIPGYDYKDSYEYPWIQHALVTIGHRANSSRLIQTIGQEVIESTSAQSSDRGAALCVLGYQILGMATPELSKLDHFINELTLYLQESPSAPMQVRWSISCSYLLGQLYLKCGKRSGAVAAFQKCIEFDFLRYSPTLATKAVDAAIQIGIILLIDGKIKEARESFKQAIEHAQRAFSSSWSSWYGSIDEPLTFGLTEASQVLDLASQAAYALWLTAKDKIGRPGDVQAIHDFSAQAKLNWWQHRETQLQSMFNIELKKYKQATIELKKWNTQLEEGKRWLESKYVEQNEEIERLEQIVNEIKTWNKQLEEGKAWLDSKYVEQNEEIERLEQVINQLKKQNK